MAKSHAARAVQTRLMSEETLDHVQYRRIKITRGLVAGFLNS